MKEEKEEYKCINIFLIIVCFKIFVLLFILYICFKKRTEVKIIKKAIITRNLISKLNITNYNMIRMYDWENLEFNSISIFKYFRKKYFNVSYISYDYYKENNTCKLEYLIGLFDEDRNLINPYNSSNLYEFSCFHKIQKDMTKRRPIIAGNNYSKCVEYFNFNETIKFGFHANNRRAYFNIFLDFSEIFNAYKLNNHDKI